MAKEIFECPHVDSRGNKTYLPQFLPVEGTSRKITKIAYKLNKKVLCPQTIEKTSVKLAYAVFHESTKNALTLCCTWL